MPSKLPQYNLHAEKEIFDKMSYIATFHDRSLNKEIVKLMKNHIVNFEKKYGEIDFKNP